MKQQDKELIRAISRLANCNPFSPERFAIEKEILGRQCEPMDSIAWNRKHENQVAERPNVIRLTELSESLVNSVRESAGNDGNLPAELKDEYWDVATYLLLYKHITQLKPTEIWSANLKNQKRLADTWQDFLADYRAILGAIGTYPLDEKSAAHLFACLTQVHRAFFNIFDFILGESRPIARLREKVWESIFTCNIRRYHRILYGRMRDLSTLITGPSGTGKELVARAIGLSQYVPFDAGNCRFQVEPENSFLPLNLSALSPTLIESELFGHHRGAFTGAVADREGWLEVCCDHGAVFLDEIGELDLGLQVKLLRVVQQRTYCRLGETKQREFCGKLIAATNRDLFKEIEAGRFREDFYFRLCTDRIQTPSLRVQLDDHPEDLDWLITSIVRKHLGEECEALADEVADWINSNLGKDYPWNGNIRELEQCVSSYIIRQEYIPANVAAGTSDAPFPAWLCPDNYRAMTAEQLLGRYCTWLYLVHGSYEKTAQVLNVDRRTVKAKLDQKLLNELKIRGQQLLPSHTANKT